MKCNSCVHEAKEGYINTYCLKCKYAYFENTDAFQNKSDLYEEKTINHVHTIEDCCEMIKLQGKLISDKLNKDEQFYVNTLNQIVDRILELYKEEQSSGNRDIIQNYNAKDIIDNFFKRSN